MGFFSVSRLRSVAAAKTNGDAAKELAALEEWVNQTLVEPYRRTSAYPLLLFNDMTLPAPQGKADFFANLKQEDVVIRCNAPLVADMVLSLVWQKLARAAKCWLIDQLDVEQNSSLFSDFVKDFVQVDYSSDEVALKAEIDLTEMQRFHDRYDAQLSPITKALMRHIEQVKRVEIVAAAPLKTKAASSSKHWTNQQQIELNLFWYRFIRGQPRSLR